MTTGEKKSWKWRWWHTAEFVSFLLVCLVITQLGLRKPWIEPPPGVQMTMLRPFAEEEDFGSNSAYRLLLRAIATPVDKDESRMSPTWQQDWMDAIEKFRRYGWPEKPPPAPLPAETREEKTEKAASGEKREKGPFGHFPTNKPWTLAQYQDVGRLLKLYEFKVLLLDRALTAPDQRMPMADSSRSNVSYTSPVQDFARWLAISAHYHAEQGLYEESCLDVERILALGNLVSRGGCLTNNLAGIGCHVIAADAAWQIAARKILPVPIRKRMALLFLRYGDETEPFAESIRGEALRAGNNVASVYKKGVGTELGMLVNRPLPVLEMLEWTGGGLLPLTGSSVKESQANLLSCYRHLVVLARKPYSIKVQKEHDAFVKGIRIPVVSAAFFKEHDPVGHVLALNAMLKLDRKRVRFVRRTAAMRGVAAYFAIKAHAGEREKLPENLEALVPYYLPRVPKDPFDQKPFRYLQKKVPNLPDSAWAVYSIGENFTDDGGEAYSVGKPREKFRENPDLVWPSQAYSSKENKGGE